MTVEKWHLPLAREATVGDRDPVEVLRRVLERLAARHPQWNAAGGVIPQGLAALAELERRQGREARLVALVRELGKCVWCGGDGRRICGLKTTDTGVASETRSCSQCSGTGLVEAARKEVGDG